MALLRRCELSLTPDVASFKNAVDCPLGLVREMPPCQEAREWRQHLQCFTNPSERGLKLESRLPNKSRPH
jgi:hypothetical protein